MRYSSTSTALSHYCPVSHPTHQPLPPVHLATLEWSHCARLPVATSGAQCALVGGKVYVGGGTTDNQRDLTRIFRFDPERGNWYCPQARCPVAYFAMAEFQGELIVVGGIIPMVSSTGLVHRFKDLEWEEYLQPMPTARNRLSIITTESAIVACGGESDLTEMCCETVEVFTTKTGQWHTADPLPFPWYKMSSVRIGDTGYLLGGGHQSDDSTNTVVCVPLSSLIEKASSAPSSSPEGSLWKTLPPTPHYTATAAALKGQLVAVAGQDEQTYQPFLHVFIPSSNTWERMPLGDLPESTYYAAAIRLSDEKLFVCGGTNPYQELDCVYVGAIADP